MAPRLEMQRPPWFFTLGMLAVALVVMLNAVPRLGLALEAGTSEFATRLGELFPTLQASKQIELPSGGGVVSADITATLPDFTRDPTVKVAGRIPSFAQGAGRMVEISLNGALLTSIAPDATGAFAANVDLRDGPNAIALALVSGKDVVAHSSYTVVLDRQPPGLILSRPLDGARVEGPTVQVDGKAEAGASVIVDGRTIVPAQDGSFSDRFSATPGALTITVVARDRAGNETTVKTPITVVAPVQTVPLVVGVTLDNSRVRPSTVVTARILVTANGVPVPNEQVTLSVGVITIGTARTNSAGMAVIGFAAPSNEGDAFVVVLASGGASGRAPLTVAR